MPAISPPPNSLNLYDSMTSRNTLLILWSWFYVCLLGRQLRRTRYLFYLELLVAVTLWDLLFLLWPLQNAIYLIVSLNMMHAMLYMKFSRSLYYSKISPSDSDFDTSSLAISSPTIGFQPIRQRKQSLLLNSVFAFMPWLFLWTFAELHATGRDRDMPPSGPTVPLVNASSLNLIVPVASTTRVLLLIMSSWILNSALNRQAIRETWLTYAQAKGLADSIHFQYRFILGRRPTLVGYSSTNRSSSLKDHDLKQQLFDRVELEASRFKDVLFIDVEDGYSDLTRKVYYALLWAKSKDFHYLLKTDDDCFLRLDLVLKELISEKRRERYWQGQVYRHVPPLDVTKNADVEYPLSEYPPYTSGLFYSLSKDVVRLVTEPPAYRRLLPNEDQALGVWLFPFGMEPTHDRRIQQWWVCENDMLAKHLASEYIEPVFIRFLSTLQNEESTHNWRARWPFANHTTFDPFGVQAYLIAIKDAIHLKQQPLHTPFSMRFIHQSLQQRRSFCTDLKQDHCALCYSCANRKNHFQDWYHDCNSDQGITLLRAYRP